MLTPLLRIALSLALLTGCAAPPASGPQTAGPTATDVPPGKAMIELYRPGAFLGAGNVYAVRVDGMDVAELKSGTRFAYPVEPGPVTIEARALLSPFNLGAAYLLMDRPSLAIVAEEGHIHYVEVASNTLTGGPSLKVATAAEAAPVVARLKSGAEADEQQLILALTGWPDRNLAVPAATGPLTLGYAGIVDARADKRRIGSRTAAFGVSMGSVYLDRPVPGFVEEMVLTDLRAAGHQIVESGEAPALKITLRQFWFDTKTTALYWDVNGRVELSLTLIGDAGQRSEAFSCAATERTYSWPSEDVFRTVADRCLMELIDDARNSVLWRAGIARADGSPFAVAETNH